MIESLLTWDFKPITLFLSLRTIIWRILIVDTHLECELNLFKEGSKYYLEHYLPEFITKSITIVMEESKKGIHRPFLHISSLISCQRTQLSQQRNPIVL